MSLGSRIVRKVLRSIGKTETLSTKRTRTVDSNFGKVTAYENDFITRHLENFGNHTRPEFAFATSVLQPSDGLFDLGAHVGTFSMTALTKMSPAGRVLAVEGSPSTYRLLASNLDTVAGHGARRRQVTALNAFIADPARSYELREDLGNSGGSRLFEIDPAKKAKSPTPPVLGIDDLVNAHFAPDYIKLDTEGTEGDVLAASHFVAAHTPVLYIEVNPPTMGAFGSTSADLDTFLASLGYSYFVNDFDRNANHDLYRIHPLPKLDGYEPPFGGKNPFFDVLCVPNGHRLLPVLRRYCRL